MTTPSDISAYMRQLGAKGGASTSQRKAEASKASLYIAREARVRKARERRKAADTYRVERPTRKKRVGTPDASSITPDAVKKD
jgi:hypothetical protein